MILAIDLGSTAFKAAIFDCALHRLGEGAGPLDYHFAAGGIVELDAGMLVDALRVAIHGAFAAAGLTRERIAATAIGSQAQTFTVTDADGSPRLRFISWQDTRAGRGADAIAADASFKAEFAEHCSFPEILKSLQLCQLRFIQDTQPGFIRSQDRIVCLPEYIAWLATEQYALDTNLAAMNGLYSVRDGCWWPRALAQCGVRMAQLAQLVPIGRSAGLTTAAAVKNLGVPAGVPFILAGNDQTAGAYGAQVREKHALLVTLGTAQVGYTCEMPVNNCFDGRKVMKGPYPGGAPYHLIVEGAGGAVVNWAERVVAGGQTDETFFALAAQAPAGANGLVFVPDLVDGCGRWECLGLHHTPADLARSVIEALTTRMVRLIDCLGLDTAKVPVLVAGGGSRQPLWVGMLAAQLRTSVERANADPLTGAARMAAEFLLKRDARV